MRTKIALLLTVIAIAGCRSANEPMEPIAERSAIPQVTMASAALRSALRLEPPRAARDEFGLLHVTLPLRNARNTSFTIDYKATFFDDAGGKISETGWLSLPLESNTPAIIQVNSTSDRAADFMISLRRAK